MTLYTRLSDGAFGLSAAQVHEVLPDISFVPGADLTGWGYAPYAESPQPAIAGGEVAVEVAPIGGVQQWTIEAGPPVRRLIAKSLVQERVHALGKLGAAFAALNGTPIAFGRWFAPDWPNVYFDDEGLLAVLNGIGFTEAEIAAVTAP